MVNSPRLALPYLAPAQAQKHVTVNETLRRLDALVQLAVLSATTAAEPGAPAEGDAYILPASPTGTHWGAMAANSIAAFQDGAWIEIAPGAGWRAYVADTGKFLFFGGAAWLGAVSLDRLGVNAASDATNKLSVKSDAELLSHDDVTPGTGDARKIINKSASAKTASVLFQDAFSGRAEFGLTGDDDFHLKTSPDGAAWKEAAVFNKTTGAAKFPSGVDHAATSAPLYGFIPTPGGDGTISIWRSDTARSASPRTAVISSVAADVITLTTTTAAQFFTDTYMNGVSYVRIWNTSKTPNQSAWVKAQPVNNQLQVLTAADIAAWAATETIQVGDPTSVTPIAGSIAIDISPMLTNVLGAAFPQQALLLKMFCAGSAGPVELDASGLGTTGSYVGGGSYESGAQQNETVIATTTTLSPISNSNLLFVREKDAGAGTISIMAFSVLGVFG